MVFKWFLNGFLMVFKCFLNGRTIQKNHLKNLLYELCIIVLDIVKSSLDSVVVYD